MDTSCVQTTIKASKKAKKQLERLRAQVARVRGHRVSQRELVDHLITSAARDPAATASSLAAESETMGPKEFREFLRKRKPWGIKDGSVDVDIWVYGGGK